MMPKFLLMALIIVTFANGGASFPQAQPTGYNWSALTQRLQSFVPSTVNGLTFMLARNGEILYAQALGNQNLNTVLPIASATKMPSGLVLMSLVDSGLLDLDKPVAEYFQGKIDWPADKAAITTRMLFNHTSGLIGNSPCMNNQRAMTLKECAQEIARAPLEYAPGTRFSYGGASMQVAGYVAEAVSGKSWNELFAERIATPLGLTRFTYTETKNPRVAGGAVSDVGDYTKMMQMFLAKGFYNGRRVLSEKAVEEMTKNQIAGLPKLNNPGGNALPGYSFGWWISDPRLHPGSRGPELSDQGAFGCTPWIDLDLNYSAIILIYSRTRVGTQIWNEIRPIIINELSKNR